jgi:hypothetical protein
MVVKMNLGVTLAEICACLAVEGGLKIEMMRLGRDCFDGDVQRVVANKTSREIWVASNVNANCFERNVSSPTKRQFTVHLKKNCRVNSNARER